MPLEKLIVNKLKCKNCSDFVKRAPIMMDQEHFMCTSCYNGLPEENRPGYTHQVGLERICAVIQFPCRYHASGCTKKLEFNSTVESHEASCRFSISRKYDFIRFNSVEDDDSTDTEFDEDHDVSPPATRDLSVEMNCTFKRNKTTRKLTILRFAMDVKSGHQKLYSNFEDNRSAPVSLKLTGVISLGWKNPTVKFTGMDIVRERFAAGGHQRARCLTCKESRCQKVHDSCPTCKLELYKCACSKAPQPHCRYFSTGCRESLGVLRLPQHVQQCEYQEYPCLFPGCTWSGTMQTMKIIHLPHDHKEKTVSGDQVRRSGQADDLWAMIAFGKVFVCKQYCYEDSVDIAVQYMGSPDNSDKFVYCVRAPTLQFFQKSKCCTVNSYLLDGGIQLPCSHEYVLFIEKARLNEPH